MYLSNMKLEDFLYRKMRRKWVAEGVEPVI